jgi:hypothetical protein
MTEPLKNILANLNKDVEQDKLLEYLNKQLSASEQHSIERSMNDDEFLNDAVEGLQEFDQKNDLTLLVQQLNKDLNKQLEQKKKRKKKKEIPDQSWFYYAVVVILVLCVIAFFVIRKMNS